MLNFLVVPHPSPLKDKLLSLAALAAAAAQPLLPSGSPALAHWGATLVSVLVAVLAAASGAGDAARAIAALLACLVLAMRLPTPLWQLVMLVAIVAYLALGRLAPSLRPSPGWRARGALPLGWTALVGGVTPFALGAWVIVFRPDLADVVKGYIPDLPLPVLVVGVAAFALVNASLEEIIWRGVLQDRLTPVFGAGAAVGLQAISFGLQHFHGVPRGVAGVLLAGVWAVALGVLRRHTRGMLAPVVAHVVADVAVGVIVLLSR